MVAGWEVTMEESMKGMVPKMARSLAGKKLPPVPSLGLDKKGKPRTSIMLFYQYVEPAWTPKQHRRALTFVDGWVRSEWRRSFVHPETAPCKVHDLGRKLGVTGRGRCSAEGLNLAQADMVEAFCLGRWTRSKITSVRIEFKICFSRSENARIWQLIIVGQTDRRWGTALSQELQKGSGLLPKDCEQRGMNQKPSGCLFLVWFEDPHKPSHRDCRVNTVIVESCGLDSAFSLPYSKKQGLGFLVWWHWLQNHRRLRASQEVQAALAALGLDSNAWIMTQWLLHRVAEEPDNSKEGGTCIYVWISSSCRFF